jgi:hypothetical protein
LPGESLLLNHQAAASELRCSKRSHWRRSRTDRASNTSANQYAFCRHLGWIVVPRAPATPHPGVEYKNWLEFDPRETAAQHQDRNDSAPNGSSWGSSNLNS